MGASGLLSNQCRVEMKERRLLCYARNDGRSEGTGERYPTLIVLGQGVINRLHIYH